MGHESRYFTLSLESLRALGSWAADCAERALSIYETYADSDPRPRAAIEGIREFARGGKRTAQLRSLALSALAAAREADDPAAAAAARAAGLAASSAYTHPLVDVQQTKHIVGPAAYAALALELNQGGDHSVGDHEVRWAIEHVPAEVRDVLLEMPARQTGNSRLDKLLYELDAGIRPVPFYANKERGNMQFSTFYQELQHSTEMIRALLSGVEPEAARLKPNAESWSILEVVCHLYDEEREDFREHLDFILSTPTSTRPGRHSVQRLKTGLSRQQEGWHVIDTEGWVTERKYNEQNFAEMQEKFFSEREKSFAWLKGLQNPDWEKTYTTPYRTISAGEMFACWVAHDNLHLRQLVELRRLRLENITKPYNLEYAGDW